VAEPSPATTDAGRTPQGTPPSAGPRAVSPTSSSTCA